MALTTLAELIAAGAHRTVENVAAKGEMDVAIAANYLSQRYGNQLRPNPGELAALVGRVQDAMNAAGITQLGQIPLLAEVPDMPGLQPGYNYLVIGSVGDPTRPKGEGRAVEFPMRFNSPTLMTFEELQRAADELINNAVAKGQLRFEGALHGAVTLPGAAAEIVRDEQGGESLPTIEILSVYRGVK